MRFGRLAGWSLKARTWSCLLPWLLGLVVAVQAQQVLISEIMYHPPSTNLLEQWFELYNPANAAVNLTGWRVSKGVEFTFPTNTVLPPGGYLVVAADAATFAGKHPGVTNFVAGWLGSFARSLEVSDRAGNAVNTVAFHDEGDWAVRIMGPLHYGHRGWEWFAEHDGLGASLELINPSLSNGAPQNWGSSTVSGGTPGGPNSIAASDVAPFISEVAHFPVIPKSSESVTISARVTDEQPGSATVTLHWRVDGAAEFTPAPMLDDGTRGDGLAADGIYGAILPPHPHGTVIEFYLQALDRQGHQRTYPLFVPPTDSARTANLLYQVDDGVYAGAQPVYRIIMAERERAELYALGRKCPDSDSDAAMNATWITTDGILKDGVTTQSRYNVGVRNRGHGSRQANPNNYHLDIPSDRLWKNQRGINLNSQYAHSQVLGSAIFRRLGLPMPDSRAVQVRINSTNLMSLPGLPNNNSFGSYAANEQYNNDFIKRSFPLDPGGNAYRGLRAAILCDGSRSGVADLTWHGPDPAVNSYAFAYFKENRLVENDWSDLLELFAVLNSTNGYAPENYVEDVRRVLDVEEWMRYMAVHTLLDNTETCLATGVGDDYGLYRGTLDRRFKALPYDLDSLMGRGTRTTTSAAGILEMNALPVVARFMRHPSFAPVYYRTLKTLAETAFSPERMNPLLDQLFQGYLPQANIENMKAFNASRVAFVLSQFPQTLSVSNALPMSNGYPRASVATVSLAGEADATRTEAVFINGAPAAYVAWQGAWTAADVPLHPGINRLTIRAVGAGGEEVEQLVHEVWYDDGNVQSVGGALNTSATWAAANGPFEITSTLTIASGATLTIQPGATVYLNAGVDLVVANGGRLLAEGTEDAPIRFSSPPGSSSSWGGVTINGAVGSPETRITHAYFEGNGTKCIELAAGTLFLDHTTFGTTTHQYVSLDGGSFVLSHCVFPTSTAAFELVHGTGGIKPGGHGIIRKCFFGSTHGYNDIVDFTGGNREFNQPIIHFLDNVFIGASDDILDLDGTDAWVEGNIFLHTHKEPATPDSSSAVSGGDDGPRTSEVTIIRNLFFDCDQAATAKQGNFFTLINNTIVRITRAGGTDTADGVVNVRDFSASGAPTTFGRGFYLEGNIIVDAAKLVRNYDSNQTTVTLHHNLLPLEWAGPGTGNLLADPLFQHTPRMAETVFANWAQAQVLRSWLSLQPGSPARGSGPNGADMGGVLPPGVSISGEPRGTNRLDSATLTVGSNRSGEGIPQPGWPSGSGYVAYRWRLDGGPWSEETAIAAPIQLTALPNGPHYVEVIGKRDSGLYQNDPLLGEDALITRSLTWVVDPNAPLPAAAPTVRINEILAKNITTLTNAGATPDLIELYNFGPQPVDLSGMGLSGRAAQPYQFVFPAGTALAPGGYLVLYADSAFGAGGLHTGFALKQSGEAVLLYDAPARGGGLLDAVAFGLQIPDASIGRAEDGNWVLCRPTFGAANLALALGDPAALRINEWLADARFVASHDFFEVYNLEARPVALGGLFLSDAAGGLALSPIPPLSYIAGGGFVAFIADGDPQQGADHVNFKLSADVGMIVLSAPDLSLIDAVNYGPQQTDVSQGRSPSGGDTVTRFPQPTLGGPNPSPGVISVTNIVSTVVPLVEVTNTSWRYDSSGTDRGTAWRAASFNDTTWKSGLGLFGYETTPQVYPYAFKTTIPAPDQAGGQNTVYYRTHFTWASELTGFSLLATNYIDDGAVFYLNGVEVGRLRVTANPVVFASAAGSQPNEGQAEVLSFPASQIVAGDNVLAVEVHQVNATSSDDVFGMSLAAVTFTTNVVTQSFGEPVVLNEILARNQTLTNLAGHTADFIELFNPSSNIVSLAGLSLSNDPNQPRKFVFPGDATLAPGGFWRTFCDDSLPPSSDNTGFALGAKGDGVFLFDRPPGGALLDGVRFGLQAPDFSIGRLPDGEGAWILTVPTPEGANNAAALGSAASLAVNEWMADPVSGADWFEVFNADSLPVALGGLYLTDNLADRTQSPIEPLSFIGTGANGFVQFIADGSAKSGAGHVSFSLKKSGEQIGIFSSAGVMIDGVTFGQQVTGVSQGRLPDGGARVVAFAGAASPGEANYLPLPEVVISEVLTHTDPPLEDALEFFNPTGAPVNLGGWFLSNDKANFRKYRIPDPFVVPPSGFRVLYEYQFGDAASPTAFTFNSAHGDGAILSQADNLGNLTGYRAQVKFGAAENGVSLGRYQTSVGLEFVALSARTFGQDDPATVADFRTGQGLPNAAPRVGPVAISEIMFHPVAADLAENPEDEFVELLNISNTPVPCFDPAHPTNTWRVRDAIDLDFPPGITLAPGARLLLVAFPVSDARLLAAFRAKYAVPSEVPVLGPWNGRLDNTRDNLELYRPDTPQAPPHPDAGFVPYVLVERVAYSASAPWPLADGNRASLQRLTATAFGNDPVNWIAAAPSAGRPNSGGVGDSDNDGMDDAWELAHFQTLARDGAGDFDGDGMTDLQEYLAGSNPTDPASVLRILAIAPGNSYTLTLQVLAGRGCTLQFRDDLGTSEWRKLKDIPAMAADAVVQTTDTGTPGQTTRFYRLVTPAQP